MIDYKEELRIKLEEHFIFPSKKYLIDLMKIMNISRRKIQLKPYL